MGNSIKAKLAFYKSKIGSNGVTNWREVATPSHYLSKSPARAGRDGLGNAWGGSKRWIENTDSIGLRFVGFADEIIRLRHKGWFVDSFQNEVYRGAVWQMPARKTGSMYVYGHKDDNNENAAFIDFAHTDDKDNAARWADSIAESSAEREREFHAKDLAEQDILEARNSIHENNIEALTLIKEIKAAGSFTPAICGALKAQLQTLLDFRADQFDLINLRSSDYWSSVE